MSAVLAKVPAKMKIANLQTGFYAFQRVDGKTVLPEGIKLLKQHA